MIEIVHDRIVAKHNPVTKRMEYSSGSHMKMDMDDHDEEHIITLSNDKQVFLTIPYGKKPNMNDVIKALTEQLEDSKRNYDDHPIGGFHDDWD